ncbi:PTS sugar transporter [Leuconostoc rapi]|uniref:PTS sugar transporter n=1 Tax=Leuconostoc rapi TaxID=1406906 RepID=UPI00195DB970|nr:PTS sugar transporter [Leuconostoc rapi]MBM7435763.1 putative membrane protein [Leuconostoc rapi]
MITDTKSIAQGYKEEIIFQENMLRNLQHWQSFFSLLVGIGVLMTYFLRHEGIWLMMTSIGLSVVSVILMFTVGYVIYKGKKNVTKVIDSYEKIMNGTVG